MTAQAVETAEPQTPPAGGAIPMQTPVVYIANTQPAPLPPAKSFDEILAELTDPAALERHVKMMAAYDAACAALLTDADVQIEGKRAFKKKSAWRKLAQYFRVSTEMLRNERWWEVDEETGEKHLVVRVVMRGIAPWGQVMEAVGLCSTRESRFFTTGIACPNCAGSMWDNRKPGKSRNGEAFRCKNDSCPGVLMPDEWDEDQMKRRPNMTARAKADHDCEGTAATRATNRAISDLIAAGEVSAEEMEGGDHGEREETALLDRPAFGKDWKGKTWRQVLEAGQKGESFIEWVIGNAEKMSAADKAELKTALDVVRSGPGGAGSTGPRPPATQPSGGAQHAESTAGAIPDKAPQGPPQRGAAHQAALVWLSTNGSLLPDGVTYAGELVQTDDLKEWLRSTWKVLHAITEESANTAIEAANGAAAWMRLNKVSYQGSPPSAPSKPSEAAPPAKKVADNVISPAQLKRLFAIAHNEGDYTDEGLRVMVATHGHKLDDIARGAVYDKIVEEARDPAKGEWYNEKAQEENSTGIENEPEEEGP